MEPSPGGAGDGGGVAVMQLLDGELVLSASDLTGFAACAHLTQLELQAARGEIERARRDDTLLDVLSRRGTEHETAQLDSMRAEHGEGSVVVIEHPDRNRAALEAAQAATVDAMRAGVDVIFQATFFDGRWRGHADFLFRRDDRPAPALGGWSYDIADTKLARAVKAGAVLQMCVYAALLEAVQGIAPEWLTVITGDRASHRHRTEE